MIVLQLEILHILFHPHLSNYSFVIFSPGHTTAYKYFLHSDLAVIPARILEIDNTVSAAPAHSCTNISFVSSSPSQYLRKYIFEFYIHKNLSLYIYKGRGHKIQPPHQNFFNFFIISPILYNPIYPLAYTQVLHKFFLM